MELPSQVQSRVLECSITSLVVVYLRLIGIRGIGVILQNFLGFGPQPAIEVDFGGNGRRHVTVKGDHVNTTDTVPLFCGTETIAGQVCSSLEDNF